jgi:KipI family sensor histidine kinase inhibitor
MREAAADGLVIEPLGETVLLLRLGVQADTALNARVHDIAAHLRASHLPGVVDIVPAYAALALHYTPEAWQRGDVPAWRNLADAARHAIAGLARDTGRKAAVVEIPVCYGAARGADLPQLARDLGLREADLIERHTGGDYRVAMLGFAPGFPYLLGLDPCLHVPRRATPRLRVPAGSVAIGGAQTGIYPSELPGGWNLIGQTPMRLFDPLREPPCLLAPGDRVRFRAIDEREFAFLATAATP